MFLKEEYHIQFKLLDGSADSGQTVEDNVIRFDDDISGGFDTNAELFIVRVKNEQAAPVKGINPMALAVNITVSDFEREIISAKSWNINPMGAAFTIDAPDPPIPQEPIPEGEDGDVQKILSGLQDSQVHLSPGIL